MIWINQILACLLLITLTFHCLRLYRTLVFHRFPASAPVTTLGCHFAGLKRKRILWCVLTPPIIVLSILFGLLQHEPHLVLIAVFFPILALFFYAVPPAAVVLTVSGAEGVKLDRIVDYAMNPLRVVSLLQRNRVAFHLGPSRTFDSFRTGRYSKWWSVVERLVEIAPLIVMDTRCETDPVKEEVERLITMNMTDKVMFVTGKNGECPVLKTIVETHPAFASRKILIAREQEVVPILKGLKKSRDLPLCTKVTIEDVCSHYERYRQQHCS